MIELLKKVVKDLPEMLDDISRWDSLVINRRKPHTYRAFTMYDDEHRVCLHRFDPCSPEEAFLHPHPWPGAFFVLDGKYRMQVGYSKDLHNRPEMVMECILCEGSCYEMSNPLAWHAVQPLTVCYSIMVNGKPWDKKAAHASAPTTKGKDLDKMDEEALKAHLAMFDIKDFRGFLFTGG